MSGEKPGGESVVLTFTPSHWSKFPVYAICVLLSVLVVPIFIAVWVYLTVRFTRYELSQERLKLTTGVFSRQTDNLELYRVSDIRISQSFWQRMVKIGNIDLISTDKTTPELPLHSIRNHHEIADTIRTCVERMRDKKKQREFDVV
jgi:uncharacterized membrane protein YdbT with pleckstrin-like domain